MEEHNLETFFEAIKCTAFFYVTEEVNTSELNDCVAFEGLVMKPTFSHLVPSEACNTSAVGQTY